MHGDKATIGVLRPARRNALGHDPRFRPLAEMHHLGAGVRLLGVVGDGDRVKLALTVVPAQNAGRVFPGDGRPRLHLRPHHLRPVAPAIGALGDEVVDAALAVLIARIPVLDGRIFDLRILQRHQLDNRRMKLVVIALWRRAALQIADVGALVGDDQRAFELPRILRVDAEIGGKLHRAAHALRHIDETAIGEDGAVQRGVEIIRHRHDGGEVFLHQFRVLFDGFRNRAENHARLRQFLLERGAERDAVEHRIHRDLALGGVVILRPFDAGQNRLFLQGDAEFFVSAQQLRIDIVQRFRLLLRHGGGLRIVILRLEVDFRIIDHGPFGLRHLNPAPIGVEPPVGHPFRFVVLFGDEADDILVQAHGRELGLDLRLEAVFVFLADGLHRRDGFLIDTVFHDHVFKRHLGSPSLQTVIPAKAGTSGHSAAHAALFLHRR